jgi:xylulokinase
MFQSPVFTQALAGVSGATIELYDTDGSAGAAKGAGIGAGIYRDHDQAFASLQRLAIVEPRHQDEYRAAYARWKSYLNQAINK